MVGSGGGLWFTGSTTVVSTSVLCVEMQLQLSQMTSDLKEERVAGKRMKGEIQQLQDDLSEATGERDSLKKACTGPSL